jgi:hypothetical protein
MSDIYLQITETPTVVTLSQPVIGNSVASTVTVANTVTVALDANSLSALENVTVTVGAAITGTVTVSNFPASQAVTFSAVSISNFPASQAVTFSGISVSNFPASQAVTFSDASLTNTQLRASAVTIGGTITVGNFPASQAVTFGQAIVSASNITGLNNSVGTDGNTPTSTNFIKIGGHQDGSNQVEHIVHVSAGGSMKVDASDSTVTFGTIRGTVTIGNTVTIAGTVTIGSLPAISGTVTANTFALQGTAVTTSNFTSTTASTVLANYNATREVLTIFNEGAGNLHVCVGATCTTIAYQVRLSAGDYYEVPNHQTTITHSAVFATAGTARVTEVS